MVIGEEKELGGGEWSNNRRPKSTLVDDVLWGWGGRSTEAGENVKGGQACVFEACPWPALQGEAGVGRVRTERVVRRFLPLGRLLGGKEHRGWGKRTGRHLDQHNPALCFGSLSCQCAGL